MILIKYALDELEETLKEECDHNNIEIIRKKLMSCVWSLYLDQSNKKTYIAQRLVIILEEIKESSFSTTFMESRRLSHWRTMRRLLRDLNIIVRNLEVSEEKKYIIQGTEELEFNDYVIS